MTDEDSADLTQLFLSVLISLNYAQTQLTAMRFALEEANVLTPSVKDSTMLRAQEIWGPRRRALEEIRSKIGPRLEDLPPIVDLIQ